MYLKEIFLQNTGPISECHVKLPFIKNGDEEKPLPVIIVGPNGSGKTIFLSYIADALFEFAKIAFSDIVDSDGLRSPYFRVIHQRAIKSGAPFSLSLLHFKVSEDDLYYCEKSGILDPTTYSPCQESVFSKVWKWPENIDHKNVLADEETVKTEMQGGAHAFFPASRHEEPIWLNPKGLNVNMDAAVNRRFATELDKPLQVKTCAERNISWILDLMFDSAVDVDIIQKLQKRLALSSTEENSWNDSFALHRSRQNIERILQAVVQDMQAKLQRKHRNNSERRLSIRLGNGQVIPNLQSLSDGQSQLFHLFTTIIRYGESTDVNNSINLSDIIGLIVIDEIDANLHPTFQHDVLPELIKMFPKVQFIVSSHSPLFLLGMEKRFGLDRVKIFEMPEAKRISNERYSEFGKAFEYFQSTERYEEDIRQRFSNMTKPFVLTEGKTDAKYIQTALELFGEDTLINSLEIQPVGAKVGNEWKYGGKDGLNRVKTFYEKDLLLLDRMLLLLYDWDADKEEETSEKLWIRSMPKNPDDINNKAGIENLFSHHLFQERFYEEEDKKGVHGRKEVETKFKKKELCQWICEERRNPDDFEKFKEIVVILKEFLEVAQQPPTPEIKPK